MKDQDHWSPVKATSKEIYKQLLFSILQNATAFLGTNGNLSLPGT